MPRKVCVLKSLCLLELLLPPPPLLMSLCVFTRELAAWQMLALGCVRVLYTFDAPRMRTLESRITQRSGSSAEHAFAAATQKVKKFEKKVAILRAQHPAKQLSRRRLDNHHHSIERQ